MYEGTQRRPLSHVTKIDKNLGPWCRSVATSAVAVGTGRIAHHIPDTSSITSFVFKNHGVQGGLYPAAITSAPSFAATPSASSALRSARRARRLPPGAGSR